MRTLDLDAQVSVKIKPTSINIRCRNLFLPTLYVLPIFFEIDHGVSAAADHHGDLPVEPPERLHERHLLDPFVHRLTAHRVGSRHPADRLGAVRRAVVRENDDVYLKRKRETRYFAIKPIQIEEEMKARNLAGSDL